MSRRPVLTLALSAAAPAAAAFADTWTAPPAHAAADTWTAPPSTIWT